MAGVIAGVTPATQY